MTIFQAIIFGILQGLTEFLPVSSSGHLVLFSKIFEINGDFVLFSVIMHMATLLAVVVYFWRDICYLIKHPFCKQAKKLYLATIPTVFIVLIFKGFIKDSFEGILLPFCFMFTAVLLIASQILSSTNNSGKFVSDLNVGGKIVSCQSLSCKALCPSQSNHSPSGSNRSSKTLSCSSENDNDGQKSFKKISNKSAIAIGIAQGIAILPGISRSGATICTGLILGHDRDECARFSFLMSIPIILASMAYELIGFLGGGSVAVGFTPTIIAFVFAFGIGLLSIGLMMRVVKKLKLYWFAIYLIVLAIISFFVI